MRRMSLLLVAVVLAIAGCGGGGGHHHARTAPPSGHQQPCNPKPGTGTLGSCVPKPKGLGRVGATQTGPKCVDVSSYQGHPNWSVAKPHIRCAIVKAGEGTSYTDSTFAYNWSSLRRLHILHTTYYFLRPGNCIGQAIRFVSIVKAHGGFDSNSLPPVADAEVPGTGGGFADCFIHEASRRANFPKGIVYTSPGTWSGSAPRAYLWVATYGSRPGCTWTCSHVAWQFTGDNVGPLPHSIAGVGSGIDISTDNGITKLIRCPSGRGTVYAPWRLGPCKRATFAQAVSFVRHHPVWTRHHPVWIRNHPKVAQAAGVR